MIIAGPKHIATPSGIVKILQNLSIAEVEGYARDGQSKARFAAERLA
jgi:hypothetical protein